MSFFTISLEYLLAEYYIESLLCKKSYRLNVRSPSKETIGFLGGIIHLMLEKDGFDVRELNSEEAWRKN